jgi:hypothetical protein
MNGEFFFSHAGDYSMKRRMLRWRLPDGRQLHFLCGDYYIPKNKTDGKMFGEFYPRREALC